MEDSLPTPNTLSLATVPAFTPRAKNTAASILIATALFAICIFAFSADDTPSLDSFATSPTLTSSARDTPDAQATASADAPSVPAVPNRAETVPKQTDIEVKSESTAVVQDVAVAARAGGAETCPCAPVTVTIKAVEKTCFDFKSPMEGEEGFVKCNVRPCSTAPKKNIEMQCVDVGATATCEVHKETRTKMRFVRFEAGGEGVCATFDSVARKAVLK
mmetsp:Transcript_4123/g.10210  ORF Transcript_4123/g.10210 Transcript_4123/m.10210 type:complete len:218 (+) Transcript_4123:120-773(+)